MGPKSAMMKWLIGVIVKEKILSHAFTPDNEFHAKYFSCIKETNYPRGIENDLQNSNIEAMTATTLATTLQATFSNTFSCWKSSYFFSTS